MKVGQRLSGFASAVTIDESNSIWRTEMRIPLAAVAPNTPVEAGTTWRMNLYRHATAERAFLGWSPTATGTAHTPARFGYLLFDGAPKDREAATKGAESQ